MTSEEIRKALDKHALWLRGKGGERADLRWADLRGADLDYSAWPLWCGSLYAKGDDQLVIQLLYHVLRLAHNSEIGVDLKGALFTPGLIEQANRFHLVLSGEVSAIDAAACGGEIAAGKED